MDPIIAVALIIGGTILGVAAGFIGLYIWLVKNIMKGF